MHWKLLQNSWRCVKFIYSMCFLNLLILDLGITHS